MESIKNLFAKIGRGWLSKWHSLFLIISSKLHQLQRVKKYKRHDSKENRLKIYNSTTDDHGKIFAKGMCTSSGHDVNEEISLAHLSDFTLHSPDHYQLMVEQKWTRNQGGKYDD